MEDLKRAESKKNWKETAKDRRTWTDLPEKVKTHKGLLCQMMMMMMMTTTCFSTYVSSSAGRCAKPKTSHS
jgi:hypothetical protein